MIELEITDSMVEAVTGKAKGMGAIRNSITRGSGNIAGFLGEEIALQYFSDQNVDYSPCKDYDMVVNGVKVDVKTKRRGVEPQPHYTCHISDTSMHQQTDVYVFAQVNMRSHPYRGWLLGWLTKEEFLDKAVFKRKGEADGYGHTEKADAYVCTIADLNSFDEAFYKLS